MTGMLASVTNIDEARIALDAGADIIDLKNPVLGALGALPRDVIVDIVRYVAGRKPVSATVGDLPMEPDMLLHAVEVTTATGADIVKVGFFGNDGHAKCVGKLVQAVKANTKIVAVLFADQQPDMALLPMLAAAGFYGVMLDTADKSAGSLRYWLNDAALQHFVGSAQTLGLLTGLAGALRQPDIRPLLGLGADYLGFRGALCANDMRVSRMDYGRVERICQAVAGTQHNEGGDDRRDCKPAMPYV